MSISGPRLSLLAWHVHGSWMTSFVAGRHRYLLPLKADRGPDGRGRCGREWPNAQEVPVSGLRDTDVDLVVLQRPEEIELTERWLGRRPGVDVPAVYVEHNSPRPDPVNSVHPLAGRDDITIVHVTDVNRLMWDNGIAPTVVIPHGIPDPGHRYVGDIPRAAAMVNEPVRRGRVVGTDLLTALSARVPIDVWGIGTEALTGGPQGLGDLPTDRLHAAVARRRVYLHTARWTSLGLSLIEAMFLGMPVVAVAATAAPLAVPPEAGMVSADLDEIASAAEYFIHDHTAAEVAGKAARDWAQHHFGLAQFLRRWDLLIEGVTR